MNQIVGPQPAGAAAPSEPNLWEILAILRRQWWIIIGCAAVGLVLGILYARSRPPVYEAAALVRVDDKRTGFPTLDNRGILVPTGNQLGTEMMVLGSRSLAEATADSLGLQVSITLPGAARRAEILAQVTASEHAAAAEYRLVQQANRRFRVEELRTGAQLGEVVPGQRFSLKDAAVVLAAGADAYPEIELAVRPRRSAVDQIVGSIQVTQPNRNASVIRVQSRGRDPRLAQDIVNVLVARFMELRREAQTAESQGTIEFLRRQLDTIAVQLTVAEGQLQAFRERARVIDPVVEGSTGVRRLADLQAERSAVEAERAALQQLVAQAQYSNGALRPSDPSPYRRLVAFPTLLRSGASSDLLRSLLSLEDQRTALLNRRSLNDPEVQALTGRIGEVEAQLGALVTTYLEGLGTQVGSLDATVRDFERQLGRIPENEVQFARLSRQPKVLAETYALLQMRLKEAEVAQAAEDQSVRLVDAAALPTRPVGSRKRLIMAGSMLLGLVLGVGLGVAREYADPSVRTRGDVQLALGIPVLGLVPRLERERGWRQAALELLPRREAASSRAGLPASGAATTGIAHRGAGRVDREMAALAADAYDRLHTNLLSARATEPMQVVLFTSALPGDGKTTTAANFAVTLAQRGLRVVLLDADLRRGRVNDLFGVQRAPGLADLLNGQATLADAVHTVPVGGAGRLDFVTTGAIPVNPAQLLGSERMSALLARLRELYDRVVIDSSPLNVVSDVIPLGTQSDSVIMVARAGVTPVDALLYAAEQLHNSQMPVVGTLLNDIDFRRDASYDGAYRWYAYGKAYYSAAGEP